jgi:hypothetical protein
MRAFISSSSVAKIVLAGSLLLATLGAFSQQNNPPSSQPNNPSVSIPAPAASGPVLAGSAGDANGNAVADSNINIEDRMLTPPPVSGQEYPLSVASAERANYLRGGVVFNTAYSDNVLYATSGTPVSDVSYSVWPTLSIDQTLTRLHWVLSYAPGFTFYQRVTSRNEADQDLSLNMQYRLSPHVTVSLIDTFQKSSDVFNQPGQGLAGAVSGSDLGANNSIIAPLADRLSNYGSAGITYQFGANDMVGANGTFSNLHYPNQAQVPGLYDAATRGGSGFYSHRLSARHYVGVTYQYQDLLSYPVSTTNQTQTDAALFFYTFYPRAAFSVSFFGGPQYYNAGPQYVSAIQPTVAGAKAWSPAAGASLHWQALHTAVALSYSHSVSGGGGLTGAVELDSASGSVQQQLTRNFSASLTGSYANNGVLSLASLGGHSISGSAALQRQIGQSVSVQAGYTRLRQTYSFFSSDPNTNREWVSISYQFARALGR